MDGDRRQFILPMEEILELMQAAFAQGGSYCLVVTGWSMSPTLKPGRDAVRLTRSRKPRWGDIVFAPRRCGGYMLHRVVKLHADGTATLNGDGQVWLEDVDEILALAEAIRRKGKWISVDNVWYRLYVFFWAFTRPVRNSLVSLKKWLQRGGKKG